MNIVDYQRCKFEIAEILNAASLAARKREPDNAHPFQDLFARLAEDRFNIVVTGKFSRGKTTLMNAMLSGERLPTGIVPVTSAITAVQYGASERAVLKFEDRHLESEIPLDSLPDYISQKENPGNEKRVKEVLIELPCEILRQGFRLVDTPGLGSSIAANTRTTETFLPEADALILVTSFDSPMSQEELQLAGSLFAQAYRLFVVVNKKDLVAGAERDEVLSFIRAQLAQEAGSHIEVFPLSAREAVEANRHGDADLLAASGVPLFVERLTRFLVEEKQAQLIHRLCDRLSDRLAGLGDFDEERRRLSQIVANLETGSSNEPMAIQPGSGRRHAFEPFRSCAVCARIERELRAYLQSFQYDITVDRAIRSRLAEAGGLCAFHTWQYAQMASPFGTSLAFPEILERLSLTLSKLEDAPAEMQAACVRELLPAGDRCALCRVEAAAERRVILEARSRIAGAIDNEGPLPDICLQHLPKVLIEIDDRRTRDALFNSLAIAYSRIAEDMRRYAIEHQGLRRALATRDEISAHARALIALVGHKDINFNRAGGAGKD